MDTPYSESFMHLHLGIDGKDLDFSHTGGHHVVVLDKSKPISQPGNVCMISIASVWEPDMAPEGCHCVHAYTMEPFDGWKELKSTDRAAYEAKKKESADKLYVALEKVIPDIRARVLLELIASPVTHKSWLRRHKGTYGAAIRAPDMFPGPPVSGVKTSTASATQWPPPPPGVGVPAAAGSGVSAPTPSSHFAITSTHRTRWTPFFNPIERRLRIHRDARSPLAPSRALSTTRLWWTRVSPNDESRSANAPRQPTDRPTGSSKYPQRRR